MEFGLVLGPVFPPRGEMSTNRAFELEVEFGDRAAASGFDGVSMGHHYLPGPEAQFFQPLPLCGYLFGRYPDLYVATTILILPYHNPVEIAEQVATLDAMAPGRFLLGVGQGYKSKEAHAMGIAQESRRERLTEGIAAMRLLWSEGFSTYAGKYYSFDEADIGARPSSAPPIMIAADRLRTIANVPRIGGDFWISSARHSLSFLREAIPVYTQSLAELGREFLGIPMTRDVCLAKDERAAVALVKESYEHMLHMQSRWGQPGEQYDVPFEQLREERLILGDPEQVASGLISLNREFGGQFVFMRVYTPGMDPSRALDMVTQLGEEVLPVVRREVGAASLFGSKASVASASQ